MGGSAEAGFNGRTAVRPSALAFARDFNSHKLVLRPRATLIRTQLLSADRLRGLQQVLQFTGDGFSQQLIATAIEVAPGIDI